MFIFAFVTLIFVTLSTTLATMLLSGRISRHEEIYHGYVPVEVSEATLDAEPAIG